MVLKPAAILKAEALAEHEATMEAARRFARRCVDELAASQVYLFGSRARGDWHRGSDCDVLVVSERFAGVHPFERPLMVYDLWDGPVSVEPFCATREEFERGVERGGLAAMALAGGALPLAS